jgi:hypothetical protein
LKKAQKKAETGIRTKIKRVSAMSTIVSRLDVTQIFCDVDDFCSSWERMWEQVPQLPSMIGERRSTYSMHLSEVMTITIAFHGSGYRTNKRVLYAAYTAGLAWRIPKSGQLHQIH